MGTEEWNLRVLAEEGSTVTYAWATNVLRSRKGYESRLSLVAAPRETYEFTALLDDAHLATLQTALIAGHRTAGGFLLNPIGATINLCINEQGTASGTTSAGALTCILPGQSYVLTPAAGAVSVITSDSSHPFSGYGLN